LITIFFKKNELKSSSSSAIATNKDTNSRTEDQKEEEISSSSEEVDNEDNLIITSKDIYTKGIVSDSNTHPMLHMFNVPLDHEATLHHLHCDVSKTIMSKNNVVEHEHPKNTDEKVKLIMLNEGKCLSAKKTSQNNNKHCSIDYR